MFENLKFKISDRDLNYEELRKLSTFLFYFKVSSKVRVIYRGENYENLKNKLNLYGNDDYSKLSYIVFLVGDKGRTYRKSYRENIKKQNKVYAIDCIDDDIFEFIFSKMKKILNNSKKSEIIEFKKKNDIFSEYFLNSNNKTDFIDKIKAVTNNEEKIRIRDYYLSLMHQIGKIGFYNNSFFTSTSFDYNSAMHFAKNDSLSEKIIFVSWVKYPQNDVGVSFNYLNKVKKIIRNSQLPEYNISFFPEQNEFAVKGGLLPHYILGYIKVDKNEFEINPNFFSTKKSYDAILKDGFEINQVDFYEVLDETDYKGYFMFNLENDYSDVNE